MKKVYSLIIKDGGETITLEENEIETSSDLDILEVDF